jgi:uncharacterized protein (UPF0216 family)
MKTVSLQEKYNRAQFDTLLEAIDENELRKIAQMFDKLDQIVGSAEIPAITEVLDVARDAVAKVSSPGFVRKLASALGGDSIEKKQISSIIALQTQLVSMFRSFPSIISIAGPLMKSAVSEAEKWTGGPTEMGNTNPLLNKNPSAKNPNSLRGVAEKANDTKAIPRIEKMLIKALSPDSIRGFFTQFKVNAKATVDQILDLDLEELKQLIQRASGSKLQVPISQEDVSELSPEADPNASQGPKNLANVLQKLTPEQKKSYIEAISFMEKIGQKINPEIKKAFEKVSATTKAANPTKEKVI